VAKPYLGKFTLELRARARELRSDPTPAENVLWQALRRHQLGGYKFRRQVAIDQFIVDFCCLGQKLIIELDGKIHLAQREQDRQRSEKLTTLGFRVLRFSNEQVLEDIEIVKANIIWACKHPSPLAPLPQAGEEKTELEKKIPNRGEGWQPQG
jgi:very-short-patch-repair endonuclease